MLNIFIFNISIILKFQDFQVITALGLLLRVGLIVVKKLQFVGFLSQAYKDIL
jgi:hypothetical protein